MFECRFSSLQFDVCQNSERTCEHPWLFFELDKYLEDASHVKNVDFDRPHLPSPLFGNESWGYYNSDRCRWRDSKILEHFPQEGEINQIEIKSEHWIHLSSLNILIDALHFIYSR